MNALKYLSRFIPDRPYLQLRFFGKFGRFINFRHPVTFSEKLQWLKLNDRNPEYPAIVDKATAKDVVAKIIGEEYIIPTLGIWDRPEDIDFDSLPDSFVLKCTNDSGGAGIVLCDDKNTLDRQKAMDLLSSRLKHNCFWYGREWPYRDLKPRIIAEEYLKAEESEIEDFKFHCFNGVPKIILNCRDRYSPTGLTEDFYDTEWNRLEVRRPNHPNAASPRPAPEKLAEMLALSEKLSAGTAFMRCDFYETGGKVYFGELTLYPASGLARFVPDGWDEKIGAMLDLGI